MRQIPTFFGIFSLLIAGTAQADNAFSGAWKVTKAEPAPWLAAKQESKPHFSAELEHAHFVFGEDQLSAPIAWMGCTAPNYEISLMPFNSLFEGGLEDPGHGLTDAAGLAHKLGFKDEPVTSMYTGCSELLFHLADENTAMFALDNVIYTLTREKPNPTGGRQ